MKKKGFLRQKTENVCGAVADSGQTGWCYGIFFTLFLAVLLSTQLQLEKYHSASLYLEDALAASNLASAVVDVEEYGISHTIRLSDPYAAYIRCQEAVKGNLNLDSNWECANESLITGRVELVNYIIYNVEQNQVFSYQVAADGRVSMTQGRRGTVKAPNGITVEGTGVYSEITFMTKGIFGIQVKAHKGKLVDIQGAE